MANTAALTRQRLYLSNFSLIMHTLSPSFCIANYSQRSSLSVIMCSVEERQVQRLLGPRNEHSKTFARPCKFSSGERRFETNRSNSKEERDDSRGGWAELWERYHGRCTKTAWKLASRPHLRVRCTCCDVDVGVAEPRDSGYESPIPSTRSTFDSYNGDKSLEYRVTGLW